MSKPKVFEKPLGMRDFLPPLAKKKRIIENLLRLTIEKWGYEEIITPTLEYFDTVGQASSISEDRLFKLMDRKGHMVVLRPDMTAPIARVVGSLLKEEQLPLRLMYQGSVFRRQENEAGRDAEFSQIGVELIGEPSPEGDAEMLALTVELLKVVNIPRFKIAIGHVSFISAFLAEFGLAISEQKSLEDLLAKRDFVGYSQTIAKLQLATQERERLRALTHLTGDVQTLMRARELVKGEQAKQALLELETLYILLQSYGVNSYLIFDLTMRLQGYYTGILFEGYADGLGFPVCSGGRYDELLQVFNRPSPATGCALKIDRLLEVSEMTENQKGQRIMITFHPDRREEAVIKAKGFRDDGLVVLLQVDRSSEEGKLQIKNIDLDQIIEG